MAQSTRLHFSGRPSDASALSAPFQLATRSAAAAADAFLPAGYLQTRACFDVGARVRGDSASAVDYPAVAGELLVVELADGALLVTSAAQLKASLARSRPELIGGDGEIRLDRLATADRAPSRGPAGEAAIGLARRIYALAAGEQDDAIIDEGRARLAELLGGKPAEVTDLGVSGPGTRALLWAIEQRLDRQPGLYCWERAGSAARAFTGEQARRRARGELAEAAAGQLPVLIFIHALGSSTTGSFGDLQLDGNETWSALERQFPGGIFGFEHRTLGESPIDNALQLVDALPDGLQLCLVAHSRGGLVGDLLCLGDFAPLIERFRADLPGTGDADPGEALRVRDELATIHAAQREQLRQLAGELARRRIGIRRYLRVASPAQGTRLATSNLDLFLSALLTLIGQVPSFFGSPSYSAFRRVVVEIARRRTNAHLIPGIEAMLPDSPLVRLLGEAPVRPGIEMAVIAGVGETGGSLARIGTLLSDFLLFDEVDNDGVVDTPSMFAGIAQQVGAWALLDRGPAVSHFNYFRNPDTRSALRDWLSAPDPLSLPSFQALPGVFAEADEPAAAPRTRGEAASARGRAPDLPVVVVLPGVMGSHLRVGRRDRVWFDPLDIASGGLAKIAWEQPGVEAEKVFGLFYGDLCAYLERSHRVERFAYDWRQPLDVLGERLAEALDRLLAETAQPIRVLAHSLGGLVVRAAIHRRRPVLDSLMARDGARLVLLGTPHQGTYSMVENLLGKGDTLRALVRLDLVHDMKAVLDLVSGFPGVLQLLPKPGFVDCFEGQPGGGLPDQQLQRADTWLGYREQVFDPWFGNGQSATPTQQQLDSGSWLWQQDGQGRPALPAAYEAKAVQVLGVARNTPCGLRVDDGRLKMVGTTQGDGTVTWASARIDHGGPIYYLPEAHGDLPATSRHFPALAELLQRGTTSALLRSPPALRGADETAPVVYDAGPPALAGGEALARGLLGGPPRNRVAPRAKHRLEVRVRAMDLRFLDQPILLGHYEQDPIAGPEALIDRELLDGDLSQRYNLGLYAGPRGTATVVLRVPNEQERSRGSLSGAVVSGLGAYTGSQTVRDLSESVRTGVLRYLLQVIDVLGKNERDLSLATLLLGYNSSANLSVSASVEALLRGVIEANARFRETTGLPIRVTRLDIVELYQDTAISAVYALRQMPDRLAELIRRHGVGLICRPELVEGEGVRRRLFENTPGSYWSRLMVTSAEQPESADGAATAAGEGVLSAPTRRRSRTAIAERLRFLYIGQRARAESIVQQRQPGLIETLVRQQIASAIWQEDFGRVLFQLMVPNDFKDTMRQIGSLVLVVDETTANLPWELMLADEPGSAADKLPFAVRTPVVRQLAASRFRRQVRQSLERRAFVAGNPSVEGFAAAFPDPQRPDAANPPPLPGAESEANEVADLLQGLGYEVVPAIGCEWRAADVLTRLYQHAYRVVHISAHGVFDQLHADGRRRTGVVLSDGLLITAAEIEAMEAVPELVFLSCCHLGKVDFAAAGDPPGQRTAGDANRLAASIARELMAIGVRCVVVAGWAVDDRGASVFGQVFYRRLLLERRSFGDAVFDARRAVWAANREDITWGAFQAYGDPGWLADERSPDRGGAEETPYASPDELLDELATRRASLSRTTEELTRREIDAALRSARRLLSERCPPTWLELPAVRSALGALWAELGELEAAREAYLAATQAGQGAAEVPIRDIEQLALIEAQLGETNADEQLTASALARLQRLDDLVATHGLAPGTSPERSALRGRCAALQASILARRVLDPTASDGDRQAAAQAMVAAIRDSASACADAEGLPGEPGFRPESALKHLALDALLADDQGQGRQAATDLVAQCRIAAAEAYRLSGGLSNALIAAESELVERLLDRTLSEPGPTGDEARARVARAYAETLSNLTLKPRELGLLVGQLCQLSRFCDARSVASGDERWRLAADRLIAVADEVWPGACQRDDRPGATPGAGTRRRRRSPTRRPG